ncbi:MAG: hypothetical protein ACMVO3_22780 [Thalassobaculum sp.]
MVKNRRTVLTIEEALDRLDAHKTSRIRFLDIARDLGIKPVKQGGITGFRETDVRRIDQYIVDGGLLRHHAS